MITLQELIARLDGIYRPCDFNDFCPNGLQVTGKEEIEKIATGVSASLATIEAAIEAGADALIVHHGLFWNASSPVLKGPQYEKIRRLMEARCSLLAYHLPMDAHQDVGNNWPAAADLGLRDLEPFCEFGVMGKMAAKDREALVRQVEGYYEHPAHAALGGPDQIERVAILSGGGHKTLAQAADLGLDCLITGSFDEPQWHMAFEEGIHFLAMGHSATERVGPRLLADQLEAQFIDVKNPF